MKTGTYKLYRSKNHYHVLGEKCYHTGRPKAPHKRTESPIKRFNALGALLVVWAMATIVGLPFQPSTMIYTKAYAEVVPVVRESLITDHSGEATVMVETLSEKIERISDVYKVNPKEIAAIIQCESNGSTTVQSSFTGRLGREKSFGLSQIHISVHDVTYVQAIDPDFAIDFLAKHWKVGHRRMWYHCSKKLNLL